MSVRKIVKYPASVLKKEANPVIKITKGIKKIINDMFSTLSMEGGVGLAAPQIGISKKIIIIDLTEYKNVNDGNKFTLINPVINDSKGEVVEEEGCLSFPPEIRVKISRFKKINVSAIDINGKKIVIKADGLLSRVIQHEIDHINGILLIDRMSFIDKLKFTSLMNKPSLVKK